jgi:hypothetical protein
MRELVVKSAFASGIVWLVVGFFLTLAFGSFISSYRLPVLLASFIVGAGVGAYMAVRAIRAAIIYGTSLPPPPSGL